MLKKLSLIIMLFALSTLLIQAQDSDDANDPNNNKDANACYDGGTLEGKCDSEVMWQAGWYLIRFEYDIFDRNEIPAWVSWALPPEIAPAVVVVDSTDDAPSTPALPTGPANCWNDGSESFIFAPSELDKQTSRYTFYGNLICTRPDGGGLILLRTSLMSADADKTSIITASSNADAMTKCQALFSGGGDSNHRVASVNSLGYNTPSNWYACEADSGPIG
ncbi:MAG: hypothetical protein AAF846_16400 [Chloroflexota bacterium]